MTMRYFKALYFDKNGKFIVMGRFTGTKPKHAACKALTGIYKEFDDLPDIIKFGVREYTRGSKHKIYIYEGNRSALPTPIIINLPNGKTITYNLLNSQKNNRSRIRKQYDRKIKNLL